MTRKAAVAVIGGGVIGASVAYHLAKAGIRDIVIIDRSPGPGAGSTGRATGGFRAQFATPINVQLSLLSRQALLRFEDETGVNPGYRQVGYLWLACNDSHLKALRDAQHMQRANGLTEAVELSVAEASFANPCISLDGVTGAAFCSTDGYIRPLEMLRGYLEAGSRLGVEALWSIDCIAFEHKGGRIVRVKTSAGDIDVETVVNAGGPWASNIAAMAGVDLRVTSLRRQAAVTHETDALPDSMPMTIFLDTGFHLRVRDRRGVLCWPTFDASAQSTGATADESWVNAVDAMRMTRVPALRTTEFDRSSCYAGLYEMSPDHHCIVGFASECENMFLVNGSSGHGVMHSPALGAIAADLIAGRAPAIDVHQLRPARFQEGAAIQAVELL